MRVLHHVTDPQPHAARALFDRCSTREAVQEWACICCDSSRLLISLSTWTLGALAALWLPCQSFQSTESSGPSYKVSPTARHVAFATFVLASCFITCSLRGSTEACHACKAYKEQAFFKLLLFRCRCWSDQAGGMDRQRCRTCQHISSSPQVLGLALPSLAFCLWSPGYLSMMTIRTRVRCGGKRVVCCRWRNHPLYCDARLWVTGHVALTPDARKLSRTARSCNIPPISGHTPCDICRARTPASCARP